MNAKAFLLVGAGGAFGSMARYGASYVISRLTTPPDPHAVVFPYATLTINIVGSFIIGILFGLMGRHQLTPGFWLLLASGFCGGFTTFSTFALENVTLMQKGQSVMAILYVGISVVIGLLLCRVGMWLAGA